MGTREEIWATYYDGAWISHVGMRYNLQTFWPGLWKKQGLRIEGAYLNEKTSRHVLGGEVVNSWFRLVTCERTGYWNHIGKKID